VRPHFPRPPLLRDIPADKHAVIEASAGTGKTFTIEHLVVDLLLRERVAIEQILVLTFTERAATELRLRIQAKIEQVLRDPCSQTDCPHDKEHGVWWIDEDGRRTLRNALSSFDAAPIGTIHGFFGRVLAEHAFHSGRLFQGTLEDGLTLFDRAFRMALRRSLAMRPGDLAELLSLWMEEKGTADAVAQLGELFQRCYSAHSNLLPSVSLDDLKREVLTNPLFHHGPPPEPARLEAALKAAKVHHSTARAIARRAARLVDMIQASGPCLTTLLRHGFQETLLELTNLDDRPLRDLEAEELARGLRQLMKAGNVSLEAALVQIGLPIAARFLERHKAATGEFDYDDMITGVDNALSGPGARELIASLRRRYRFALIDEFQDTDRIQWSFFERVFVEGRGPHRVYLVGDPKQAIYSFRGADVVTYIDARDYLEQAGSPRVRLSASYRSTPQLIEAHNLIFDQSAEMPFFEGEIGYDQSVEAGRSDLVAEQAGVPTPPVHLLKISSTEEKLGMPELRRALARAIGHEAREILFDSAPLCFGPRGKTEPVQPRDVFVLTATNSEAVYVSRALREYDVPFSFYKQDGLFQTDEARAVRDLLAAIDDPSDPRRRASAWITPFFEVPLAALLDLQDIPDSHPLLKRLVEWNKLAHSRRFESLFDRILDESGILRRLLFLEDNERSLTNYIHLLEILLEQARAIGCDLADLVATLSAYIHGTRQPPGEDAGVQRLESDRNAVQIMTIHKSKGLEAAVVFVFGGFSAFRSDGVYAYHDRQRERTLYIGDDPDAEAEWRREQNQEQARLFYVALTRAQARLYLPLVPGTLWSGQWKGGYSRVNRRLNELEETLTPADFERLFRVIPVADHPLATAQPAHEDRPQFDPARWTPPPARLPQPDDARQFSELRRRHAGYEVTSYSRMNRPADSDAVPLGREELDRDRAQPAAADRLPEGELPGGAAAGTLLHEILELVPFDSPASAPNFHAWLEQLPVAGVVDAALAKHGFDQTHRTAAAEMAYHALKLAVPLGNRTSIPALCLCQNHQREMEFLFPYPEQGHPSLSEAAPAELVIERGFIKGYVDLVVEHDGLVYFADWKSDVLDSYQPDALRVHVQSHYALQAKLYALALVKALDVRSHDSYEARFGGLVYIFLRGQKGAGSGQPPVYFDRPSWSDILAYEREVKRLGQGAQGDPQ
jgi:exodeoxyribonuclease V beta subunit